MEGGAEEPGTNPLPAEPGRDRRRLLGQVPGVGGARGGSRAGQAIGAKDQVEREPGGAVGTERLAKAGGGARPDQ